MMSLVLPKALQEMVCSRKVSISEQEGLRPWDWWGAVYLLLPSEVAAEMVFLWKIVALFLPWWIIGACPEEKDWHGHKKEQVEVCDGHRKTHSWTQTLVESVFVSGIEQDRDEPVSSLNMAVTDTNKQEMYAFGTELWPRQAQGGCVLAVHVSRHNKEGIFGNIYDWDRTQWVIMFGTWARQTRHSEGIYWGQQRLWGKGDYEAGKREC